MKKKLSRLGVNKNFSSFNFILIKNMHLFFLIKKIYDVSNFLFFFKNSAIYNFKYLIDIVVCDYICYKKRFKVCYSISSILNFLFYFILISVSLLICLVSIYKIFESSIWMEREVFDMFGLTFFNNWDLRKILNDYTFFGFPLRKDFPLTGFIELLYDIKKKCTFEVLVELMQELRFYIMSSIIEFWDLNR